MVDDSKEELWDWWQELPPHGKLAYRTKESYAGCVAWPVLRKLGEAINFPGAEELFQEGSKGFHFLGDITPGHGWRKKKVVPQVQETKWSEILEENRKMRGEPGRPDKHADELLK